MGRPLATRESVAVATEAARARQTLWVTQSCFFFALAVCLAIYHGHTADTDGISYYGVYLPTMPVLFAGYLTAAWGLWWSANSLVEAGAPGTLRPAMRLIAIGLAVLLVTPYDRGTFLNWAHMVTGVAMAVVQIAIALGVLARRPGPRTVGAFGLLLLGGVLAALSLPDWHISLLLAGECVLEVGFAWSLLEWTASLGGRAA